MNLIKNVVEIPKTNNIVFLNNAVFAIYLPFFNTSTLLFDNILK